MEPRRVEQDIDRNRLQRALAGQQMGAVIECHEELGSTNDHARQLAERGLPHGTVVVADQQTAGRGRRGAAWCGVPGRDLMVSVLLRPPVGTVLSRIPLVAALALAIAVERQTRLRPRVKWPNDLWLGGRKLAGVLSESGGSAVVLGIGCNINSIARERPPEVAGIATSLREAADGERWWNRTDLLLALLRQLQEWWPAVVDPVNLDPDFCMATGPGVKVSDESAWQGASPWSQALERLAALSQFATGDWLTVETGGREARLRMEGIGHEGQLWVSDANGRRQALYQVDRIRAVG